MGFNSAFKGLKLLKNLGKGRLNNLNHLFLNVLKQFIIAQQSRMAQTARESRRFNEDY